jgi:hypothetical protein
MATSRHAAHDGEDLVQLYLNDIGRHSLLSKDDEIGLAQRIECGVEARRQLDGQAASRPAGRRELSRRVRDGDAARRTFVFPRVVVRRKCRWGFETAERELEALDPDRTARDSAAVPSTAATR